jgi:hypothetical protein
MIESEFMNGWQAVHESVETSTDELKKMTFLMYLIRSNRNYID